jgi:hypothetical protein
MSIEILEAAMSFLHRELPGSYLGRSIDYFDCLVVVFLSKQTNVGEAQNAAARF